MSARLAAYELYTSRGIIDPEDTRMSQLQMQKDAAEDMINDIRAGRIVIDAVLRTTTTYPTVEPPV